MAHSTRTKNCTFIHNGDCSGEIEIVKHGSNPEDGSAVERITIEFEDLVTFMGWMIQHQRISELEQKPAHEILGLKRKDRL